MFSSRYFFDKNVSKNIEAVRVVCYYHMRGNWIHAMFSSRYIVM